MDHAGRHGIAPRVVIVLLALLAAAPVPDPDPASDPPRAKPAGLSAQQSAQARAQAAAALEQRLAQARVEAAARLRVVEEALAQAAAMVADLTARRADAERRLAETAAAMAPMLPVIERLSLYPAETLLAAPLPPEQAVRGVLVIGGVAHLLAEEAVALRARQAEVARLREQIDAAIPTLTHAREQQAQLAAGLDAQLAATHAERVSAEDAAAEALRQAAENAAKAEGLRAAITRIDADHMAAERIAAEEAAVADRRRAAAAAAAARQRQAALAKPAGPGMTYGTTLTSPVAGRVVRAFGAETDAGPASGVSYQAAPNARVVSPCGGRVVFAGPFRSFGLLMIVDCGGGYHFVLSGLQRLDAQVGQAVQSGDPVGVMPDWNPQAAPGEAAAAKRPALYMELRKDGVAVNPAPFLRARS